MLLSGVANVPQIESRAEATHWVQSMESQSSCDTSMSRISCSVNDASLVPL